MNARLLRECKLRGQWRADQIVQSYKKSARLTADYLAMPRRTREFIETFAPLAEGAILGTSRESACTGVSGARKSCTSLLTAMSWQATSEHTEFLVIIRPKINSNDFGVFGIN